MIITVYSETGIRLRACVVEMTEKEGNFIKTEIPEPGTPDSGIPDSIFFSAVGSTKSLNRLS